MGAKFFSQRTSGRSVDAGAQAGAPDIVLDGRDHQQALVLSALRRAAGAPVSYAELRESGVELPASVVSELELAGVAIERCSGDGGAVGVRLDPENDPAPPSTLDDGPPQTFDPDPPATPTPARAGRSAPMDTEHEPAWRAVRKYRASSLEGVFLTVLGWLSRPSGKRVSRVSADRKKRVLAVTALVAGVAVVFVVGVTLAAGGSGGPRAPIAKRPRSRVVVTTTAARPPVAAQGTHPPPPQPRVPVSPALATELEARGHSLLQAGQYDQAVPVLKRAVLATGETLGGCLEPASPTCLTYAYALYDLGRAMRLSGAPQAAVPILERRLQIDNQRGVVSAELQLARQGIS